MAGLSEEMKESDRQSKAKKKGDRSDKDKANKGIRDDIEIEDDEVCCTQTCYNIEHIMYTITPHVPLNKA